MTDSEKLDLLLSEMHGMKSDMQDMKSEMQGMKNDMQIVKADTQELKERVSNVESKTTDISLILEKEIRANIQCVAEGQLRLSRNHDEVVRVKSEYEMLFLRVNILESEVRRIKERIADIA